MFCFVKVICLSCIAFCLFAILWYFCVCVCAFAFILHGYLSGKKSCNFYLCALAYLVCLKILCIQMLSSVVYCSFILIQLLFNFVTHESLYFKKLVSIYLFSFLFFCRMSIVWYASNNKRLFLYLFVLLCSASISLPFCVAVFCLSAVQREIKDMDKEVQSYWIYNTQI